jgi:chemotaxis protein methyltransferase CheR
MLGRHELTRAGADRRDEATGADRKAEATFAILKQAIIDRTGHHYYVDKDYLLRDRLDRRLNATGCQGLPDYLSLLSHPDSGAAEWQELEAEVTIGETFFFRHAEQFAALRTVILPAIIARNASARSLRIWSAGCAVGAEPYSIAILLERLLGERVADWTIDILGTDISHRILERARDGYFSNWAMRGMADGERARDFTFAPDRRQWRIADRHRRHVRFLHHNLLTLLGGSSQAGAADSPQRAEWAEFDLILCRNVLIYFSQDRIAPMMSALGRCLGPQGWLMVGYSDAIAGLPADLGIVELAGTIAFRPPGCQPQRLPARFADTAFPIAPHRPAAPTPPPVAESRDRAPSIAPAIAVPTPIPQGQAPSPPPIAAIRALADAGRLGEAAQACARALAAQPLDARLHFYDGVIAQAAGQRTHAEAALRRAIYLAGSLVMAHYHLGLLLLDGVTPAAGERVMTQVIRLCASLPETDVLPEGDGLTPRDLILRVEMRLRPRRPPPAARR